MAELTPAEMKNRDLASIKQSLLDLQTNGVAPSWEDAIINRPTGATFALFMDAVDLLRNGLPEAKVLHFSFIQQLDGTFCGVLVQG